MDEAWVGGGAGPVAAAAAPAVDGAAGLLQMKNAGARTVAQDEKSCIVFGMPKEAIKQGAVEKVVPLTSVGKTVLRMIEGMTN